MIAGYISLDIWGRLSASAQSSLSYFYSCIYSTALSKFFIKPYCLWQYGDSNYYKNFVPGNGAASYETFQDFFTRDFKEKVRPASQQVWPCEGYLCDLTTVGSAKMIAVKGEHRHIRTIFGSAGDIIPEDYYFSNVFLHNCHYHNIHSPIKGRITRIEHIPGDLLLLRPWVYKNRESLPALCNERYNIDIQNEAGDVWYLSLVGGPAVASVKTVSQLKIGAQFDVGDKLAGFVMGSTCCVASPVRPQVSLHSPITVGLTF